MEKRFPISENSEVRKWHKIEHTEITGVNEILFLQDFFKQKANYKCASCEVRFGSRYPVCNLVSILYVAMYYLLPIVRRFFFQTAAIVPKSSVWRMYYCWNCSNRVGIEMSLNCISTTMFMKFLHYKKVRFSFYVLQLFGHKESFYRCFLLSRTRCNELGNVLISSENIGVMARLLQADVERGLLLNSWS